MGFRGNGTKIAVLGELQWQDEEVEKAFEASSQVMARMNLDEVLIGVPKSPKSRDFVQFT